MKKLLHLTLTLGFSLLAWQVGWGQCTELFISEYGEGSSGTAKYIEIFNPTSGTISLANYQLYRISNGGSWPEATYNFPGGASIASGGVYVVGNNSTGVPSNVDDYDGFASWNGDDAVALVNSTVIIDVIGTDGADPGTGWDVAGVTDGTANNTMVRKATIDGPETDWATSAGTDAASSEWIVSSYVNGTPSTLGSHTSSVCPLSGSSCSITGIDPQGSPSACNDNGTPSDPSDDYYEVTLRVTYTNEPGSGTLDLTGDVIGTYSTSAFGAGQEDFVNVRLPADGTNPSVTATFSADPSCTFTNSGLTAVASCSGAGVTTCVNESFSNIPTNSSSSYQTRTWTGDDGFQWTATDARTDQTITGSAITIREDNAGTLTSASVGGGIGDLTVSTQRVFGSGSGTLDVSVNGSVVGTLPYDGSVQTTTISGINVAGNVVLEIGPPSGSGARVIIDDLTYTCFTNPGTYSAGDLVITEIMYNPSGSEPAAEWIEVYNGGSINVDLLDLTIEDGAGTSTFTAGPGGTIIMPGDYAILANNGTPGCATANGIYSIGGLSNSGELIRITETAFATLLDEVTYGDGSGDGWPSNTNGVSIQLDPGSLNATDNNTETNWCLSTTSCGSGDTGTPLAANDVCAPTPGTDCGFDARNVVVSCDPGTLTGDPSDDEWSFTINPSGAAFTSPNTYDLTLSSFTPANLPAVTDYNNNTYGSVATIDNLGNNFSVMNGNFLVTITDDNSGCVSSFFVASPGTCDGNAQLGSEVTIATSATAAGDNAAARTAAEGLNDTWFLDDFGCLGTYTPIFADFPSSSCATGVATIAGVVAPASTISAPLGAAGEYGQDVGVTITDVFVLLDNSDLTPSSPVVNTATCPGSKFSGSTSSTTYQANSPAATGDSDVAGGALGPYLNTNTNAPGANLKKALLVSMSPAVNQLSFYLGDVESRTDGEDGYPATITLYDASNNLIGQYNVSTGTVDQTTDCDGDSGGDFDGCGNDETVFFQYIGSEAVASMIISVGQVTTESTNNYQNLNNSSIAGFSCGGSCTAPFPVEWVSFTGEDIGDKVMLEWETAEEINNEKFEILRSADRSTFEKIGEMPAGGANKHNYRFVDAQPLAGTNYYRLKQIDFDGKSSFSNTIQVNFATGAYLEMLRAYPNPTSGLFSFDLNVPDAGEVSVSMLNPAGQQVWGMTEQRVAGQQTLTADLSELAGGMYFYELRYQGQTLRGRFLKQ